MRKPGGTRGLKTIHDARIVPKLDAAASPDLPTTTWRSPLDRCLARDAGMAMPSSSSFTTNLTHAPFRVFLQAHAQRLTRAGGRIRRQRRPVWLISQHRHERVRHVVAREGSLSAQHLVEDGTECPDVGVLVDGLAFGLLGRHVGRRAEHHPDARSRGRQGNRQRDHTARRLHSLERFGEAEVEHLHAAVGRHLDIRGLQIAMVDAVLCAPSSASRFIAMEILDLDGPCATVGVGPSRAPERALDGGLPRAAEVVNGPLLPDRRSTRCSDD